MFSFSIQKMPLLVESLAAKQNLNDLLREVIISSFGILLGMVFRDFIIALTSYINPDVKSDQIIYALFIVLVILFITLVIVIIWT